MSQSAVWTSTAICHRSTPT